MSCAVSGYSRAEDADLLALSLETLLQTKITGSTLTDESLQTVPSSMTVFTRADIRRLGLQNLPQLVNLVPGYQGYRSDASTLNLSMSSRGRRLGNNGSEILILLDGQRLNNDWSGGANQGDSLISIENVERVEFIRGPGSSIYGSNAVMGVINIITAGRRELVVDAGSYGRRHTSLAWNWQGEVGSLAIYAGRTESDGEQMEIYEPFPNPATPVYVGARDPFQSDDLYLSAKMGEFYLTARIAERDMNGFYVSGYVDNDVNRYTTSSESVNIGWQREFDNQISIKGHVFNGHKAFDLRAAASLIPYSIIDGGVHEDEMGTQWILQGEFGRAHWLMGWEWRNPELVDTDAHVESPTNQSLVNVPQAPEDDRIINGFFGQYQTPITDQLALTLGLRRDSYSDFGSHLSPRVGLVQQLGDADTLKLLYSEAFRAPSRIETSVLNSTGFEQNPNLRPETAQTTELVWMHLLSEGYISSTLFSTDVKDAIVETITPQFKRSWGNSQQSVAGLEFEWQSAWGEHWESRLALTHIMSPVGFIHTESNNLFSGSLSYHRNQWTYSLLANYQGAKRDPNEQESPANIATTEYTDFGGHTLYSTHLSYLTRSDVEIYLHIDNLFDKQYLLPANRPSNYVGVPGAGRVVSAGLRWVFN
ncbi:MAG: TonB-dependent receptor [Cellvibrio sp.]|uniref:TonB-dependent receptor plug domain-containing protein n=1 Tax=Cellvibrio sp. TaxID=1965322 RepID=UPI0031A02163